MYLWNDWTHTQIEVGEKERFPFSTKDTLSFRMQELQKATGKAPNSWEGSDDFWDESQRVPERRRAKAQARSQVTETPRAVLSVMFYQANKDKHCAKNKRGASQLNQFRKQFKYSLKEVCRAGLVKASNEVTCCKYPRVSWLMFRVSRCWTSSKLILA